MDYKIKEVYNDGRSVKFNIQLRADESGSLIPGLLRPTAKVAGAFLTPDWGTLDYTERYRSVNYTYRWGNDGKLLTPEELFEFFSKEILKEIQAALDSRKPKAIGGFITKEEEETK